MKSKIAWGVVLGLLLAFGWTFVKRPLAVPAAMGPLLPPVSGVDGVSFSIIPGARMTSQKAFSVRGASLTETFVTNVAAFVVEHPRGLLLIDAGVGRAIDAHWETTPALLRALADLEVVRPTADALEARGVEPADVEAIVLTHAHWDHVSGLADLRDVPVWMAPEELEYARADDEGGLLYRLLEADGPFELRELSFPDGPYGPFEASKDFFGDGSVVVVPMPGHTPGSAGIFVTDSAAKRFFVVGDTSWTREGIDWPAEKHWIARRRVDHDANEVRELLVTLHRLQRDHPGLRIIPAHDARVHEGLRVF